MSFTTTSTVTKACFDTNVFISAFVFSGKPAEIFDLGIEKKILIITSPIILSELARILREKFKWEEWRIKRQIKIINDVSELVVPKRKLNLVKDEPDNRILEAALEGQVDYIITGDKKHLLSLKQFKGIPIVTPDQFLKEIED